MANLINKENYGYTPLEYKSGSFTADYTEGAGSSFKVQQIGNVVYLNGYTTIGTSWADLTGQKLGTISGVDAPAQLKTIPIMTSDGTNFHSSNASIITVSGTTYIYVNADTSDNVMIINAFYII